MSGFGAGKFKGRDRGNYELETKFEAPNHPGLAEARGYGPDKLEPKPEHYLPMLMEDWGGDATLATEAGKRKAIEDQIKKAHEDAPTRAMTKAFQKFLAGKLEYDDNGNGEYRYVPIMGQPVKTPGWGELDRSLVRGPGVMEYLNAHSDKRHQFEKYVAKMRQYGPVTLDGKPSNALPELWMYFKYVMMGAEFDSDEFLSDYRLYANGDLSSDPTDPNDPVHGAMMRRPKDTYPQTPDGEGVAQADPWSTFDSGGGAAAGKNSAPGPVRRLYNKVTGKGATNRMGQPPAQPHQTAAANATKIKQERQLKEAETRRFEAETKMMLATKAAADASAIAAEKQLALAKVQAAAHSAAIKLAEDQEKAAEKAKKEDAAIQAAKDQLKGHTNLADLNRWAKGHPHLNEIRPELEARRSELLKAESTALVQGGMEDREKAYRAFVFGNQDVDPFTAVRNVMSILKGTFTPEQRQEIQDYVMDLAAADALEFVKSTIDNDPPLQYSDEIKDIPAVRDFLNQRAADAAAAAEKLRLEKEQADREAREKADREAQEDQAVSAGMMKYDTTDSLSKYAKSLPEDVYRRNQQAFSDRWDQLDAAETQAAVEQAKREAEEAEANKFKKAADDAAERLLQKRRDRMATLLQTMNDENAHIDARNRARDEYNDHAGRIGEPLFPDIVDFTVSRPLPTGMDTSQEPPPGPTQEQLEQKQFEKDFDELLAKFQVNRITEEYTYAQLRELARDFGVKYTNFSMRDPVRFAALARLIPETPKKLPDPTPPATGPTINIPAKSDPAPVAALPPQNITFSPTITSNLISPPPGPTTVTPEVMGMLQDRPQGTTVEVMDNGAGTSRPTLALPESASDDSGDEQAAPAGQIAMSRPTKPPPQPPQQIRALESKFRATEGALNPEDGHINQMQEVLDQLISASSTMSVVARNNLQPTIDDLTTHINSNRIAQQVASMIARRGAAESYLEANKGNMTYDHYTEMKAQIPKLPSPVNRPALTFGDEPPMASIVRGNDGVNVKSPRSKGAESAARVTGKRVAEGPPMDVKEPPKKITVQGRTFDMNQDIADHMRTAYNSGQTDAARVLLAYEAVVGNQDTGPPHQMFDNIRSALPDEATDTDRVNTINRMMQVMQNVHLDTIVRMNGQEVKGTEWLKSLVSHIDGQMGPDPTQNLDIALDVMTDAMDKSLNVLFGQYPSEQQVVPYQFARPTNEQEGRALVKKLNQTLEPDFNEDVYDTIVQSTEYADDRVEPLTDEEYARLIADEDMSRFFDGHIQAVETANSRGLNNVVKGIKKNLRTRLRSLAIKLTDVPPGSVTQARRVRPVLKLRTTRPVKPRASRKPRLTDDRGKKPKAGGVRMGLPRQAGAPRSVPPPQRPPPNAKPVQATGPNNPVIAGKTAAVVPTAAPKPSGGNQAPRGQPPGTGKPPAGTKPKK